MVSALLQSISQDDYEKARLMSKRRFESDYESDMLTSYRNGQLDGKINGKIEVAKQLLDILDVETIAEKNRAYY